MVYACVDFFAFDFLRLEGGVVHSLSAVVDVEESVDLSWTGDGAEVDVAVAPGIVILWRASVSMFVI